jgi:hypothetical protein
LVSPLRRENEGLSRLPQHEVALLLSSSIGLEKAAVCVSDAVAKLGLEPAGLTREDALAVLELIATQSGIIGVTARFAKSRVCLKWGDPPTG